MVELQTGKKIKALQIDNRGEYTSHAFRTYLQTNGIVHRYTCPHTHQQNGTPERKHRDLTEKALTLLAHASLPLKHWDDAILTTTYLINILPTHVLSYSTPMQTLFQTNPDYKSLKIFGCLCYPYLRPYNNHKFSLKTKPCTFLGYAQNHKGYKCLTSDGKIFVSGHVVFDEKYFPSLTTSHSTSTPSAPTNTIPFIPICPTGLRHTVAPTAAPLPTTTVSNANCPQTDPVISIDAGTLQVHDQPSAATAQPVPTPLPQPDGTSAHNQHHMLTRSKNGIYKPKTYAVVVKSQSSDLINSEPTSVA